MVLRHLKSLQVHKFMVKQLQRILALTYIKGECFWFLGSMLNIQLHTFGLARYTYAVLSCMHHSNGKPVARIHCDNEFQNIAEQGAILNFSLLDCHERTVGYSQVSVYSLPYSYYILYYIVLFNTKTIFERMFLIKQFWGTFDFYSWKSILC